MNNPPFFAELLGGYGGGSEEPGSPQAQVAAVSDYLSTERDAASLCTLRYNNNAGSQNGAHKPSKPVRRAVLGVL